MKLMILDGNSVVNRAFYGVGYLSSRSGQPTGAIYGFLNIMQSLTDEERPDALGGRAGDGAHRDLGELGRLQQPPERRLYGLARLDDADVGSHGVPRPAHCPAHCGIPVLFVGIGSVRPR